MRFLIIFALLFNVVYANNSFDKNKTLHWCNLPYSYVEQSPVRGFHFMKLIELSKNGKKNKGKYFVLVDDADYDWLNQWSWYACVEPNTVYAKRDLYIETINGKHIYETISMHRLIVGLTNEDLETDHIDRNGLNNQRENLRISTRGQNQANTKKRANTTSKYRGVCTYKGKKDRWVAYFCSNGKTINLGFFYSEIDAAMAWDKKAKEIHKEFANLNFPL